MRIKQPSSICRGQLKAGKRIVVRLIQDIFCKPGTSRLSLGRLVFLLVGVLIAYTVIARNTMFDPLITLELSLLPYMLLDKSMKDRRTTAVPDMIEDIIEGGQATTDITESGKKEPED